MIYEALIVPHERPVTLREIKRALITYDRVVLIDPSDRDLIPPNCLMTAMFGLPLLGMNMGRVGPMGKVSHYDDEFQQALEKCGPALEQGRLVVESTYRQEETAKPTLGAVFTGGYPLDPRFVYWLYRAMAGDTGFLSDASGADTLSLLRDPPTRSDLAIDSAGDGGINDIPPLPLLDSDGIDDELRLAVTQVARARLAGFIKYAGYCEAKNLVPIFDNQVFGAIASRLVNNCANLLASDEDDPFWHAVSRILQLCHEEYLLDERLDNLSVKEVLALRSGAWGEQAAAREELFQSVRKLTRITRSDEGFLLGVEDVLRQYRKSASVVVRERANLGLRIKCDLGKALPTGGPVLVGLVSQLESPLPGIGATLAAGGGCGHSAKPKSTCPNCESSRLGNGNSSADPGSHFITSTRGWAPMAKKRSIRPNRLTELLATLRLLAKPRPKSPQPAALPHPSTGSRAHYVDTSA